jgi:hypothetical protein
MTVERLWVWIGWTLLVASIVGWPLSSLTFARGEPPTVLGLSWLALGFAAAGVLVTAQAQQKLVRNIRELLAQGDGTPS